MKLLTTLCLIGFMGLGQAQESMRSTGGGNGGFIEEMRRASQLDKRFLTSAEIRDILFLDGKELKEELIFPLIRTAKALNISDQEVAETWSKMTSGEVSLEENVKFTRIEEGACRFDEDMCTGNGPYSTIYFDVERLAENETTLAELAGLVMHEFSHHYAGSGDHPHYKLANFFKNIVANEDLASKTYKTQDLIFSKDGQNYALLLGNNFCRSIGFKRGEVLERVHALELNRLLGLNIVGTYYVASTEYSEIPWESRTRDREVGPKHNPKVVAKIQCLN